MSNILAGLWKTVVGRGLKSSLYSLLNTWKWIFTEFHPPLCLLDLGKTYFKLLHMSVCFYSHL